MVDNSDGRKKSNFVAKTSVTAGAYMDFFVNSTNYKISYADPFSIFRMLLTVPETLNMAMPLAEPSDSRLPVIPRPPIKSA